MEPPSGDLTRSAVWGILGGINLHTKSTGVVYSTICHLAKLFSCDPILETVIEKRRNQYVEEHGIQKYTQMLYAEGNLIGGVLETDNPVGEDVEDKIPGFQVFRL